MPSARYSLAAISATVALDRAAMSTSRSRAVSGDSPAAGAGRGQRRVHHPFARHHPADGVGERVGRSVLHDESDRARSVVPNLHSGRGELHRAPARPRVPHHVRHPFPHDPAEQFPVPRRHRVAGGGQVGGDTGRPQQFPASGELAGERHVLVPGHRGPHVGERLPGQLLHRRHLGTASTVMAATSHQWTRRADRIDAITTAR